ncbi:MAG TPA: zf-HC2 domain-containing protein, partial [Planctomycetota bacterium]|nr:zf-HC2 domain-containing protein [Planctomycetota bacterium]
MNVHDEIELLTDVYLAGGLAEGERREIEEHLAACDACAAILRDATEFHGWMKGAVESDAPPFGLEDRVIANLRAAAPARPSRRRGWRWLAGVAALLGLIVIGGIASKSDEVAKIQSNLMVRSGIEDEEFRVRNHSYVQFGMEPAVKKPAEGVASYSRQLEDQLLAL